MLQSDSMTIFSPGHVNLFHDGHVMTETNSNQDIFYREIIDMPCLGHIMGLIGISHIPGLEPKSNREIFD